MPLFDFVIDSCLKKTIYYVTVIEFVLPIILRWKHQSLPKKKSTCILRKINIDCMNKKIFLSVIFVYKE